MAASWSVGSRIAASSTRTVSAVSGSAAAASDRPSMALIPASKDGALRTSSSATRVAPALIVARSMIGPYPTAERAGRASPSGGRRDAQDDALAVAPPQHPLDGGEDP